MSASLLEPPPAANAADRDSAPIMAGLRAAGRVLQHERGACLFLRACPWVLGLIVAALVGDVVFHLGSAWRVILDVSLGMIVVGVTIWAAMVAWFRTPSYEHTARVLESRDPHLGSKLINILQLRSQTQDERLAPLTRELAGMAIDGYENELGAV